MRIQRSVRALLVAGLVLGLLFAPGVADAHNQHASARGKFLGEWDPGSATIPVKITIRNKSGHKRDILCEFELHKRSDDSWMGMGAVGKVVPGDSRRSGRTDVFIIGDPGPVSTLKIVITHCHSA